MVSFYSCIMERNTGLSREIKEFPLLLLQTVDRSVRKIFARKWKAMTASLDPHPTAGAKQGFIFPHRTG